MLDTLLTRSTSLLAVMDGVTDRFRVIYGVPNIIRAQHNNPKGNLKVKDPKLDYPMGWWKATNITYAQDMSTANPKNVGRFGSGWRVSTDGAGATNAIVVNNHYFPVTLDATLTMRFLTEEQALVFIQKALIASITEMMTFNVQMPTTKFAVRTLLSGNQVPFPMVDDLDEGASDKGIIELEFSYQILGGKIGFNMEVAKINNLGEVTSRTSIKDEEYVQQNTI